VLGLLISLVAHLQVDLKQGVKYFYASAAVWGFSLLVRLVINFVSLIGIGRFRGAAHLRELPGGVTRVDIETTGKGSWEAGQYVYLRLTRLNPFVSYILCTTLEGTRLMTQQSHPFTIAAAANPDDDHHTLSLLIRTRSGITEQLAKHVRNNASGTTPVTVEGPYGQLEERLSSFDDILLVAGGVGGTFVWPIAERLTRLGKSYRMVWSVKSEGRLIPLNKCTLLM
jgi:NAD(P)H-flavin reductase